MEGLWIRVKKVRSQRKYQVLPNQSLIAVSASQSPGRGCTVELTTLLIKGEPLWALGFEAGKGDRLVDNQVVASEVLKTYRGPKLDFKILMPIPGGYPLLYKLYYVWLSYND